MLGVSKYLGLPWCVEPNRVCRTFIVGRWWQVVWISSEAQQDVTKRAQVALNNREQHKNSNRKMTILGPHFIQINEDNSNDYAKNNERIPSLWHSAVNHLDYCHMSECCFIDLTAALKTVKLICKRSHLGNSISFCKWTLDCLTNRPQSIKLNHMCSITITPNTIVP